MAQKAELESKMKDCKSAADFALLAIEASQEPADLDFAKELLEKAEGMCGLPADYIKTAEAYFKIFNDKEKAEELYEEAEDACFEPLETAELGHSIAVTSGDKEKALEAGCDDYISKPINKELLFEKIMLHLSKKSI